MQRSFAKSVKERENVSFFCKRTQNVVWGELALMENSIFRAEDRTLKGQYTASFHLCICICMQRYAFSRFKFSTEFKIRLTPEPMA